TARRGVGPRCLRRGPHGRRTRTKDPREARQQLRRDGERRRLQIQGVARRRNAAGSVGRPSRLPYPSFRPSYLLMVLHRLSGKLAVVVAATVAAGLVALRL